jgi:tetratricopeptide (TPR) repeat protein
MDDKSRLTKACLILAGQWVYLIFSSLTASPALAAKEMRPLEIKQRYTQVLGILAAGDFDRAVTDLVKFEQAAVGDQQPWRYVDTLWKSKLHVIRDLLAGHDVDLLMPIIVLHHDAYFRYSEMGRRHLAQHSRTMSVELADILAGRSGTPAAKSFAGWTLVSFAAYLWSPSNIGLSADLFYRAHLLDPGNELALAGLAAAWERSGGYEKAIETLKKALRLRGADPELLLRLALCSLRDPKGAHEQALAQLSSLTRAEAPGWIRSVAYQELARARLASDGAANAETILRQALQDLPGDQQLSLQLAAVLDAQRRRREALAVLDAIEILGWESESARQTYDFWEPPDLAGVRSELRQEMAGGLATLASSLKAVAAGGGGL